MKYDSVNELMMTGWLPVVAWILRGCRRVTHSFILWPRRRMQSCALGLILAGIFSFSEVGSRL